jgi:hypothetical protein
MMLMRISRLMIILTLLFPLLAGSLPANWANALTNPGVTVLSPENGDIFYTRDVAVTFIVSNIHYYYGVPFFPIFAQSIKAVCWVDNAILDDLFLTGNGTCALLMRGLADGTHRLTVKVYAIYTLADKPKVSAEGSSEEVSFTVETSPPTVSIQQMKQTYYTSSISLDFTVNEPVSSLGYSLDGQPTVRITGNTTLTGLSDGNHNIVVYATDKAGKTGVSQRVSFKVITQSIQTTTEPTTEPTHTPASTPSPVVTAILTSSPTPKTTPTPASTLSPTLTPTLTPTPSQQPTISPKPQPMPFSLTLIAVAAAVLVAFSCAGLLFYLIYSKRKHKQETNRGARSEMFFSPKLQISRNDAYVFALAVLFNGGTKKS